MPCTHRVRERVHVLIDKKYTQGCALYLGAMKPSGGVFPSLAKPLIFVPEMTEKISLPLII